MLNQEKATGRQSLEQLLKLLLILEIQSEITVSNCMFLSPHPFPMRTLTKKQFAMADTPHLHQCSDSKYLAPANSSSRAWITSEGDGEAQKVWCSGSLWVTYWNHQELLSLPNSTAHHVSTFPLEMPVLFLLGLAWAISPGTGMALSAITLFLTLFQAHWTPDPAWKYYRNSSFLHYFWTSVLQKQGPSGNSLGRK